MCSTSRMTLLTIWPTTPLLLAWASSIRWLKICICVTVRVTIATTVWTSSLTVVFLLLSAWPTVTMVSRNPLPAFPSTSWAYIFRMTGESATSSSWLTVFVSMACSLTMVTWWLIMVSWRSTITVVTWIPVSGLILQFLFLHVSASHGMSLATRVWRFVVVPVYSWVVCLSCSLPTCPPTPTWYSSLVSGMTRVRVQQRLTWHSLPVASRLVRSSTIG